MTMPKGHNLKQREREENLKFSIMRRADDLEVTLLRVEQAIKTGNTKVLGPARDEIKQAIQAMRQISG